MPFLMYDVVKRDIDLLSLTNPSRRLKRREAMRSLKKTHNSLIRISALINLVSTGLDTATLASLKVASATSDPIASVEFADLVFHTFNNIVT